MLRLLASLVIHLLANSLGLLLASLLLDGFSINATSFISAVVIFTVIEVIAGPLIVKISLKNVPALMGGVALVTTLVGLIVTDVLSDGLEINGLDTWVLASLFVWLGGLVAAFVLPLIIFKRTMDKRRGSEPQN